MDSSGHGGGEGEGEGEGLVLAPGGIGIAKGPGAAELLWGQETPGREEVFQSAALPPARVLDLESSALQGLGATAPELDVVQESAGAAAVKGSLGGAAWGRRLAPRHRHTVERWFEPAAEQGER